MAVEALRHKTLIVDRREAGDADYLLKVKLGEVPYEELMNEATYLFNELDPDLENGLYKTSTLRDKPDRKQGEALCVDIVKSKIGQ